MTPHQAPAIPALPEPYRSLERCLSHPVMRQVLFAPGDYFTADQMNDHAHAAILADRAAGRAAGVQGEAEPVAWTLIFNGGRINTKTTFDTREQAQRYADDCMVPDVCDPNPRPVVIVPLYTAPQAETLAVAEGFVLVPREPTEAMLEAGLRAAEKEQFSFRGKVIQYDTPQWAIFKVAYQAALAAAPTPTASIAPKAEGEAARIPFAGFDPKFCPGSNPDNPQEWPDTAPVAQAAAGASRSQKMRDAGYTARPSPFACDECGQVFGSVAILQAHKCTAPSPADRAASVGAVSEALIAWKRADDYQMQYGHLSEATDEIAAAWEHAIALRDATLATPQALPTPQAERSDTERLNWLRDNMFSHKWNGVIGPGYRVDWNIVPHYRHIRIHDESGKAAGDFREAIDTAMRTTAAATSEGAK